MKDKILKMISLLVIVGVVGCKNNIDNNKTNSKEDFTNNVTEIKNIIVNLPNKDEYQNEYNIYHLKDDYLYGYNYNTKNLKYEYDLTGYYEYNLSNGIIIENKNKEIYLSIENDDYCAIKDFSSNNILVYDISEKSNCHITHIADESLILKIFSQYLDDNKVYIPGDISKGVISLSAVHNILDDSNCIYTWYRNNEKIEDSNVENYVINKEVEDADYYVEITTNEGEKVKSDSINVKINREV